MPRLNDKRDLWRKLHELAVYRIVSGGGQQDLTASATAGATTVAVASATLFTLNDPVIIQGQVTELNFIGTPATAMPLIYKLGAAQDTSLGTVTMYEAVKTGLGHITEDGGSLGLTYTQNPIRSAMADLPIDFFGSGAEVSMSFNLMGFNVLNFQTALGIPESEQGTGTPTDPYQGLFAGSAFGSQGTQCFRFRGERSDGQAVHVELYDARIEVSGNVSLNRTAPAAIPCTAKATAFRIRHATSLTL